MRGAPLSVNIALILFALVTMVGAISCSSPAAGPSNGGDTSIGLENSGAHFWQDLGDGTKVQCWYITKGRGFDSGTGGPTCDWVAYHQTYDRKP